MREQNEVTGLDRFVDAFVDWAASGATILNHMAQYAEQAPARGAPPMMDAFHGIVRETLAPLTDRHAASDVEAASAVLTDALDTVCAEILLVNPE